MDAENAKKLLPFMIAISEGKQLQYKYSDGNWSDIVDPVLSGDPENYRIKPIGKACIGEWHTERRNKGEEIHAFLLRLAYDGGDLRYTELARQHFEIALMYVTKAIYHTPQENM